MSDGEERLERKMPKLVARICGGNEHLMPQTVGGCGCEIGFDDEYRCVDCGVYFHRTCIKVHWEKRLTQDDVDRECADPSADAQHAGERANKR